MLYRQVLNNFLPDSFMQSQDSEEINNPSCPWQASAVGTAPHRCPWFLGLCFSPPRVIQTCCSSVPVPASCMSLSALLCGERSWPCFLLLTAALSGGTSDLVHHWLCRVLCWTLSESQLCSPCSAPAGLCLTA